MGKQFESKLYTDVSKLLRIRITGTTPYNPKSNTQVERIHKDLHGILKGLMGDNFTMWEELLPQALFSIRTAICRTTGLAPFQILFGRNVSAPLDLIFGNPEESFYHSRWGQTCWPGPSATWSTCPCRPACFRRPSRRR
jgi:hypothetical protein